MAPADSDSLAVDSLGIEEIDMVVDEFGNVVPVPKEHNEEVTQQPQPDEPQAALEPKEE